MPPAVPNSQAGVPASIQGKMESALIAVNGGMTGGGLVGEIGDVAHRMIDALKVRGVTFRDAQCTCLVDSQMCRVDRHAYYAGYREGEQFTDNRWAEINEQDRLAEGERLKPVALGAAALWASGGEAASPENTLATADKFLEWLQNS